MQSITPPWAGCSGLVHLNQSRGGVRLLHMYCPSSTIDNTRQAFNLPTNEIRPTREPRETQAKAKQIFFFQRYATIPLKFRNPKYEKLGCLSRTRKQKTENNS